MFLLAAKPDDVPDDEEVACKFELLDQLQFALDLTARTFFQVECGLTVTLVAPLCRQVRGETNSWFRPSGRDISGNS